MWTLALLAFASVAIIAASLALMFATPRRSYRRRPVSEITAEPVELRGNRAMALMLAAIAWKGDPTSDEEILSLADEFLQYIEGNNAIMPRPDKLMKGAMPKP